MHRAVLGVSLVATMWDVVHSVFVLEARDVEGEIFRGGVAVDVVEDPGDIVERGCVAFCKLVALVVKVVQNAVESVLAVGVTGVVMLSLGVGIEWSAMWLCGCSAVAGGNVNALRA